MPTWPPHTQDAVQYSLAHLDTFQHTFERGGGQTGKPLERYVVTVQFSDHCFTAGTGARDDLSATVPYAHQTSLGERRLFSLRRYRLSHRLPVIVRNLMAEKCFFTQSDQYFVIKLEDEEGQMVDYELYFKVIKVQKRLTLTVETAFPRDPSRLASRPKFVPTNFASLLHSVQHDRPMRRPQQGRRS